MLSQRIDLDHLENLDWGSIKPWRYDSIELLQVGNSHLLEKLVRLFRLVGTAVQILYIRGVLKDYSSLVALCPILRNEFVNLRRLTIAEYDIQGDLILDAFAEGALLGILVLSDSSSVLVPIDCGELLC